MIGATKLMCASSFSQFIKYLYLYNILYRNIALIWRAWWGTHMYMYIFLSFRGTWLCLGQNWIKYRTNFMVLFLDILCMNGPGEWKIHAWRYIHVLYIAVRHYSLFFFFSKYTIYLYACDADRESSLSAIFLVACARVKRILFIH